MGSETNATRTEHGFDWGNAKVTCVFERNGHRFINVTAPRGELQIRITPAGIIRSYDKFAAARSAPKSGKGKKGNGHG